MDLKKPPECQFTDMKTICVITGIIIVISLIVAVCIYAVKNNSSIPLLIAENGAEWIRYPDQTILKARPAQHLETHFFTSFDMAKTSDNVILSMQALKFAKVFIDGKEIYSTDLKSKKWKRFYNYDLGSRSRLGRHELWIIVTSENSHPALLAYSKPIKLYSSENWYASHDGKKWVRAISVNRTTLPSISYSFPRADRSLIAKLPFFGLIFILVFLSSIYYHQIQVLHFLSFIMTPSKIRLILIMAMIILAINNIAKLPINAGMDIHGHLEYIQYVAIKLRLPPVADGWQSFQAPLFYIIAAVFYKIFLIHFSQYDALIYLRIIPLACGIAQIEICYRIMKLIYPENQNMQIMGILMGGLLPMNIYMSQFVGNEPLAALFLGITIYYVIQMLKCDSWPPLRMSVLAGLFLGLALLTKISAILITIPILIVIPLNLYMKNRESTLRINREILTRMLWLISSLFIVSSFYFIRNWSDAGNLISINTAKLWWQDPGYRTINQIFTFGTSLFYPIYSSISGFWDSIYSTLWLDGFLSSYDRPSWNYDLMLSSAWISLFTTAAILIGIGKNMLRPITAINNGHMFIILCLFVYFGAIYCVFLIHPVLSTAKSTYALGLTPCIAILCVEGLKTMTKNRVFRAAVYGIISCWAVGSYCAYFVL